MIIKRASTFLSAAAGIVGVIILGPYAHADMIDDGSFAAWEVCAMCHGADGLSAVARFPKLAGQKPHYIDYQLRQFRSGLRRNDGGQMQAISTEVQERNIAGVAKYFSEHAPAASINAAESYQLSVLGKQLFEQGRAGVPACQSCHGDPGSLAPWLDGQHRSYLEKQLADFSTGKRVSSISPMTKIAESLSDEEISAVSNYLSSTLFIRTK